MSGALLENTVSLVDVRQITRLRRGEPGAIDEFWEAWSGRVWSCCLSMASDRSEALAILRQVYGDLSLEVRGWTTGVAVACQIGGFVYREMAGLLELPALDGIPPKIPERAISPSADQIPEILTSLPPAVRLVYLVDLFFRCPANCLAPLVGEDEKDLRMARASAAYALVAGGGA